MQTFAITVLIILIIGLTHVYNWFIRLIFIDSIDRSASVFLSLALTFIYAIIMTSCFHYVILWGYPLITKT